MNLEDELIEEVFGSLELGAEDGNIALDDIFDSGFISSLEYNKEPSLSINSEIPGCLSLLLDLSDNQPSGKQNNVEISFE